MCRVRRPAALALVSLGLVPLLAGCGNNGRPELGRVVGRVTYKGQPVSPGTIVFSPTLEGAGQTGQLAQADLQPDGSYDLSTFDSRDGAVLGDHIVTVRSTVPIVAKTPPNSEAIQTRQADGSLGYRGFKSNIPKKYGNPGTTPLRSSVKAGRNTIDLDLAD